MNKKKGSEPTTYNKERTKSKLIKAVGKILVKEGHQNIRINKIEEVSGVAKKSIYDYFGGLDDLIKAYLNQVDFWKFAEHQLVTKENTALPDINEDFMFELLKNDFHYFLKSTEMQKIVLWGISEKNKTIRSMNEESEKFGEQIFKKADEKFKDTKVDFRATTAIFVASIYYMILHAKNNGSTMCGIDISTEEGKNRIFNGLNRLLNLTYKNANDSF
ncbi:TetR/AcrR family transcriptional regulator [Sphingobacterium siyangense]|uniref:TetR/AcrR family transcriptional regulator n=1 Tax=Sphingobacterium siyangense TaxID=459529 RepID=UPI00289CC9E0|nr:TetR/AcrR family transcriptional regulator [Sphingobacterium siyangense]